MPTEKSMKKRLLPVLILLLSISLAACSSGPSTSIDVTLTEFTFIPAEFTVPAGQEISFHGENTGAITHEFVIFKLGQTPGDHFDQEEDEPKIYWEAELAPGVEVDTFFTAPSEPGEYFVTCRTEGHIEAGMTGRLYVVVPEE
jgi:uncharacterized cupredoxin-like copper-binding protein